MKKRIYLCLAHMSDEGLEQKYIQEAFDTNWVVPLGPNVDGFEKELETFVSDVRGLKEDGRCETLSKRVVALSSGTAAVHLGLIACGVRPGDEVSYACIHRFRTRDMEHGSRINGSGHQRPHRQDG